MKKSNLLVLLCAALFLGCLPQTQAEKEQAQRDWNQARYQLQKDMYPDGWYRVTIYTEGTPIGPIKKVCGPRGSFIEIQWVTFEWNKK